MKDRISLRASVLALVIVLGAVAIATAGGASAKDANPALASKMVLFAADGMRPDLVDKYAATGAMPTMKGLLAKGLKGDNGLKQGFPPNTGVGWYTLATGTWPSEHGSTNNTFHRTGEGNFNNRTSLGASILQADSIHQAAERAGKKVASVEWVGVRSYTPALQGPVVDFRTFFSNRGVLVNYDMTGQPAGANAFGVSYQRTGTGTVPAYEDAAGWTGVPSSATTPKQAQLKVTNTAFPATDNVDRFYDLYIYDTVGSAAGLDHVMMVPSTAGKNGAASVANLAAGDWADIKVTLTGARVGQTAGFYVKAIEIGAQFRLYFASIARANATYNALGPAGSAAFEETLAAKFPSSTAADFAVLEAGIVDEETYVEQGLKWKDAHFGYLNYILAPTTQNVAPGLNGLGYAPDLLTVGNPVTDEFSHQFLGLIVPTDIDGDPNPYYDDLTNDNVADGRTDEREGFIRSAYAEADETLHHARTLMGGDPTTFVTSDHGFAPQWYAVNVSKALQELGYGPEQVSNCRAVAATLVKECHAGGTSQLYIDLVGRDPGNAAAAGGVDNRPQVAAADYETVRNNLVNYFTNLTDPNNPGKKVVQAVFKKEQLKNVDGVDALHPNRSGDVVVVFRPPYQTDAQTPGQLFAHSQFFGQHGYLPDMVDLPDSVNMHGTFIAAGPGIRKQEPITGMRAIDVAPTASFLLGIPGPQNASGKIRYDLTKGAGKYKEITFITVSDFHGQLVPLTEAADTLAGGGSANPAFEIGGAAVLKPYFDRFRAEAQGQHFTIAAGDSVFASPPISSFFGEKPTIDMMNDMGFSIDGLGNHNFDKGQQYFRTELVPLADYPFLSANVVDGNGQTPAEWSPARTWDVDGGKLGVVGFTNEDAPTLVFPGNFDPFTVEERLPLVQAQVDALRQKNAKIVVVLGHDGAVAGTLTAPVGPGVDLADALTGVDALLADHTNFQVLAPRPNGTLLVENLSKGVRFSRVRLVLDPSIGKVIYKTADFHKPWVIGTPKDPGIQAKIDALNAELAPLLSVEVGKSTVEIRRGDACETSSNRNDGRLCESRVGNYVADSLRGHYGATFGITNSGGLRANLTCPAAGGGPGFCPGPLAQPPYVITVGQVITVLPFGNFVSQGVMHGDVLKKLLENAVSSMPGANGRFGQVSGLCFTYDLGQAVGSRVVGAVYANADGTCSANPVDLTATSDADTGTAGNQPYTVAMNDFMAAGGDGYNSAPGQPSLYEFSSDGTLMELVVRNAIAAAPDKTISPSIQGRITCTDTVAPNQCPVISNP